jgi:hypothetical protein
MSAVIRRPPDGVNRELHGRPGDRLSTAEGGSIGLTRLGRRRDVTAIAPDPEKLRALDADTCQAWSAYNERVRMLTGEEYEHAEPESWDRLQDELRRLEEDRKALSTTES